MFATVCVVELVRFRYCVTVTVTFPEACRITAALPFEFSVEVAAALVAIVCAGGVEFEVEIISLLVPVKFWDMDNEVVEIETELLS